MKRMIVAMLFCAFSVVMFVGCGGGEETSKKTTTTTTTEKKEEKKP